MKQNLSDNLWGAYVIFKREFFSNLKSIRMIILMIIFSLFVLFSIFVGSFIMSAADSIPDMDQSLIDQGPIFILGLVSGFIYFIGPLIAIVLAFDVIVKEKIQNSLNLLLCRPVGKRAIALGKFLGVTGALAIPVITVNTIAVIAITIISNKGIEFVQAAGFIIYTIIFFAIYILIAQVISSLAKTTTTAILSGIGIWFLFWLFLPIISNIVDNSSVANALALINPGALYSNCISHILDMANTNFSGEIPIWGYHLVLFVWLFSFLLLAIEIFHRKED